MGRKIKYKGKVLRVKSGYNPNSSSMGSNIPAFFAFAFGSGAFTVIVLHAIGTINRYIRKKKKSLNPKDHK